VGIFSLPLDLDSKNTEHQDLDRSSSSIPFENGKKRFINFRKIFLISLCALPTKKVH
jgi:hypothetical protein